MPADVQVTNFATNPDPVLTNQPADLDFTFDNFGDQATQNNHTADVDVTDANGNLLPTVQLAVVLGAGAQTNTGYQLVPNVAGWWGITVTIGETLAPPYMDGFWVIDPVREEV